MKRLIETIWIMMISFSIIIHNVTLLPTLSTTSMRFSLAVATFIISLCFIFLVFYNQNEFIDEYNRKKKSQSSEIVKNNQQTKPKDNVR